MHLSLYIDEFMKQKCFLKSHFSDEYSKTGNVKHSNIKHIIYKHYYGSSKYI